MKEIIICSLAITWLTASQAKIDPTTPQKQAVKYELVSNWPQLPENENLGQVSGIAVDKQQDVFVFHRTGRRWTDPFPDSLISLPTVTLLNGKTGKVIKRWGANTFIMPHSISIDAEDNIWCTDVALHQVFKFSHEGKRLMTLGVAKTSGDDSTHFFLPTDVAVAKDGSFYVSDGYGNSRVVKFSREGKYLFAWGVEGTNAGEFRIPHAVDLDADGNVYVADRENNRIQKFDATGRFIRAWKNPSGTKLYTLALDKGDNHVIGADAWIENRLPKGADLIELDTLFREVRRFGRSGSFSGPASVYHDMALDRAGNIYVANILANRPQKFRKVNQDEK